MMKIAAVKTSLLLLSLLVSIAKALRCGTPLTTECIGATDIRYDPDSSNNLEDQAVIWEKQSGLFVGGGVARVNGLEPLVGNVPFAPDPSVFIFNAPFYEFINRTIIGSRRFSYSFYVTPISPNPEKVVRNDAFGTSTYEKDGSLVPFESSTTDKEEDSNRVFPTGTFRTYAVDENTIYDSARVTGLVEGVSNILRVCLDVNCDRYEGISNLYTIVNDTVTRVYADEWAYTRVNSPEEWIAAIYARYNESNIPLEQRLDPTVDICDQGACPTEEEWCRTDPNCSESPYQEPPASVRGGVIAGFTIAGVVILVIVLYLVHRYLLARQAQRYRTVFSKRIADTIEVHGSMRGLPPGALVEEFNRIDVGVKDGKISKEEMWEFISSGKAGEMDKHDFDALFAAIDVDGNGSVDFLEFCAFMGKCHNEYRAARVDRGSIVARSSRRLHVADTIAHHLSEKSLAFQKANHEEEEEGEAA